MSNLIAIIPARGNSKRLPNKNLLPCNGIPLVVRAIRVAKESGLFGEQIFISSEDERILDMAVKEDAHPFSRNPILSGDNISTASVVIDVLARTYYSCEAFCVLNPTSPLRTAKVLKDIWTSFQLRGLGCLMTAVRNPLTMPEWTHDGTALFCLTKAFLIYLNFDFMRPGIYEMQLEASIDINTAEDFARAEEILKERESV